MSLVPKGLREAERDARSHIEKGTGLSDGAVTRICEVLLEVVRRNDEAMAALDAKLRAEGNPDVWCNPPYSNRSGK
jgi:hypothetical protein